MIRIGTSGFSYRDWIGPVYAPGTKPREMLAAYARRFPIVEIDSTYYGVPTPKTVASWAAGTPDEFRFTAKLPKNGTHLDPAMRGFVHADVRAFRESLEPLVERGKLAAALMQFPTSFRPDDDAVRHIEALREALTDVRLVAEFRHRDWQTDETLRLLRDLDIGLAIVDEPQFSSLMRPVTDTTATIAYVRFHGRNYAQWWSGDNVTRYDYEYTEDELGPWVDRLIDIAATREVREVLAFFNNHRRGQAVKNAQMFAAMLEAKLGPNKVARIVSESDDRDAPSERTEHRAGQPLGLFDAPP